MAIPLFVGLATVKGERSKVPGALVADFITTSIIPGIKVPIGDSLHVLMAGYADRAIRIDVVIRTRFDIAARVCVGHIGVEDRLVAFVVEGVIGTVCCVGALCR